MAPALRAFDQSSQEEVPMNTRLYYMSLDGVGPWHQAFRQASAQLRPYQDYLRNALRMADRNKPVLAWRPAKPMEERAFQARLEDRYQRRAQRASRAKRRRDRRVDAVPKGHWVVLEPPPWREEEPYSTFEKFFEAQSVHQHPACKEQDDIPCADYDREGNALLLTKMPISLEPREGALSPTAEAPFGPLLWIRPNTTGVWRQLDALARLHEAPAPRHAPLLRLLSSRAQWPTVEPALLEEDAWSFLRADDDGRLRDGTEEQRRFVSMAFGTPDFALLEGPPGSGKTTAICELIVQLLRDGQRVLLVAPTHVAVDNVLERLITWQDRLDVADRPVMPVRIGDEDRVTSERLLPYTMRRLELTWRDDLLDFFESPGEVDARGEAARTLLQEAITRPREKGTEPTLLRLLLDATNLVCGTTIGVQKHPLIAQAARGSAPFEPFDVMILDEASKTTFGEFLVPAVHARRWVIVGDIKQLSPYVDDGELAESVRGLVPAPAACAAAHAFMATLPGPRRIRSLLVALPGESDVVRRELEARDVDFVDLDRAEPVSVLGIEGCLVGLLHADVVLGSPDAVVRLEQRLPLDLDAVGGPAPVLPDWSASRATIVREETDIDWAAEVSWRLVRSYELRQDADHRQHLEEQIRSLLPQALDEQWFAWRKRRQRTYEDGPETVTGAIEAEMASIRRVALPSVLELLQVGFDRLPGWDERVALTDGLPLHALEQRLVSLEYQHRMHPHISAFCRERFYSSSPSTTDAQESSLRPRRLLVDAAGMADRRAWSYSRYPRRAMWLNVIPSRSRRGNMNEEEAEVVLEELLAFVEWVRTDGGRTRPATEGPWEVAILTFYRGQEALLRKRLQAETKLYGNTRSFPFGDDPDHPQVAVTLCTVDRFQGHEADLVLLSFVNRNKVGFLDSPNRLNVALTRARYQVVLVGHRSYFERCRSDLLVALARSPHYAGGIAWEGQ